MTGYERVQARFCPIWRSTSSGTVLIEAMFSISVSVSRGLRSTAPATISIRVAHQDHSRLARSFYRKHHAVFHAHHCDLLKDRHSVRRHLAFFRFDISLMACSISSLLVGGRSSRFEGPILGFVLGDERIVYAFFDQAELDEVFDAFDCDAYRRSLFGSARRRFRLRPQRAALGRPSARRIVSQRTPPTSRARRSASGVRAGLDEYRFDYLGRADQALLLERYCFDD